VTSASPWLPFGAGNGTGVRLLCLPHAGAGASTYRAWGAGLPAGITACPVQPPGREGRLWHPPYRHVTPMVADLATELRELLDSPYAIFGHSMGALVAFELAREFRRRGWPAPAHLFVAGRHAPQQPFTLTELRDIGTEDLTRLLGELGGTPPALLADPELLESIAPLLRADFSVNETYRYTEEPPLDVPITAFAATADPRATPAQLAAWRAQTSRGFATHLLPGGHFAVLQHASFVQARMAEAVAPLAASRGVA
jgi:medium-chain acyl-[acyl-carrier-protein] hydrolase